jgi:hypothetical protein
MEPTRRMMAGSFGKMPTTSVRRLISRMGRSMGLVGVQLGAVLQGGELGDLGSEPVMVALLLRSLIADTAGA